MSFNLARTSNLLARSLQKNSPTILTGLAVGGLITTLIMAVKVTPKAREVLEDHIKDKKGFEYDTSIASVTHYLSKKEIVELTWRLYIPSTLMASTTIICIVGANHINLRRNAALVGLYSLAETTLKEYQAKVVETIGENKEELIRGEVDQDTLNKNPVNEKTIIITDKGEYLFYDVLSGRYFRSDIEKLRKIQNDLNHSLLHNMFLSINEMYFEMGLEGVALGGEQGWSVNHLLEFKFTTKVSDTGEPCFVIGYQRLPTQWR